MSDTSIHFPPVGIRRGVRYDVAQELKEPAFVRRAKEVIHTADYTCSQCGFRSAHYMRVLDDDDQYTPDSELRCVCSFCYERGRLGYALANNLGTLVLAPELSQGTLFGLMHNTLALFALGHVSKKSFADKSPYMRNLKTASRMILNIQQREQKLLDYLGVSSVSAFVLQLSGISTKLYKARARWLRGVHYLPDLEAAQPRALRWHEDVYQTIHISDRLALMQKMQPKETARFRKINDAKQQDILVNREDLSPQ